MFSTFAKKIYFVFTVVILVMSLHVNAQDIPEPDASGGGAGDPGGPQSGGVPVDAGLGILLAAGASYGAKKAYDYRKNKVKSEK